MRSENSISKSDNIDVATLIMKKLKRTETDFEDLFKRLDELIDSSKFWSKENYLPYSYIYEKIKLLNCYNNIYCHTPNGNIQSINKITSVIHALYTWRFSKKIYRFSKDLVDDLSQYEIYDMEVYSQFIEKLPFNGMCLYVDNKDIAYFNNSAIIVVLDRYDHMYKCLSFYVFNIDRLKEEEYDTEIKDNVLEGCIDFTIPLINNKTLAECIDHFCSSHRIWKEYNIDDYHSFIIKIFNLLLHILCSNSIMSENNSDKYYYRKYLAEVCNEEYEECDDNIDDFNNDIESEYIVNEDIVKNEENKNRRNKPLLIDVILGCDVKISNDSANFRKISIRKNKKSSSNVKKRPHVRRGHYHHYWCRMDDGNKYLDERWINTIFVNGYNRYNDTVNISSVVEDNNTEEAL